MLKAINCLYLDGDSRMVGAREYVRQGGFDSVVIIGPRWALCEPSPGHFDPAQWLIYDQQIAQAHADGLRTFVTLTGAPPAWAYARQTAGKFLPRPSGWRLAPDDRSPSGPWGRFIEQLLTRHPHVQGIVVLNEPNAGFMDHDASQATAQMLHSAAQIWRHHRATPLLMGPATLDGPGSVTFTHQVVQALGAIRSWPLRRRWASGVEVGWAHHPYTDVHDGLPDSPRRPQVAQVLDALEGLGWAGGRHIWLTEGGYQFATHMTSTQWAYAYNEPLSAQQATQLAHVERHVRWCRSLPGSPVEMWANYTYRDYQWGGGGFMSGLVALDGTPHPLASVWPSL